MPCYAELHCAACTMCYVCVAWQRGSHTSMIVVIGIEGFTIANVKGIAITNVKVFTIVSVKVLRIANVEGLQS